jgi:hypothetical protein
MDRANTSFAATIGVAAVLFTAGCSGSTTHHLDPAQLALSQKMGAAFDDGELKLFESYVGVNLPVRRPTQDDLKSLPKGAIGPFDHHPWVTTGDVHVQMTWTLANLEQDGFTVELLLDPWNEFGRYVPGVAMLGDNEQPNLSGYDEAYDLPGLKSGQASRIQHTVSFDDMDEVATDFATAINIFTSVMATPAMGDQPMDDPRIGLVNHVFNLQNRHGSDPLTDHYTPAVIPALLGFNLGIRTSQPGADGKNAPNIVLEYALEIIDDDGNRIVEQGSTNTLQAAQRTYTLGGG